MFTLIAFKWSIITWIKIWHRDVIFMIINIRKVSRIEWVLSGRVFGSLASYTRRHPPSLALPVIYPGRARFCDLHHSFWETEASVHSYTAPVLNELWVSQLTDYFCIHFKPANADFWLYLTQQKLILNRILKIVCSFIMCSLIENIVIWFDELDFWTAIGHS